MKQVAAALIYHQGKFLIGKRRSDGSNPSVWEFPGGKLEPGESYEDCLIRECREECGLEVEPLGCYEEMEYTYPDGTIRFRFFLSRWKGGELSRNVHEELCWAAAETFSAYEFCPANRNLVSRMAEEFGHPVQESLHHSNARPF